MQDFLFDAPVQPDPGLFPTSPACPTVFVTKRVGASWSVLDNSGMLVAAYPAGSEAKARQFAQDLNDAFRRGWSARDAVPAPPG